MAPYTVQTHWGKDWGPFGPVHAVFTVPRLDIHTKIPESVEAALTAYSSRRKSS